MARVNRKPKKRTTGYTTWHLHQLRSGHDYKVFENFGGDRDAMREGWEIFRDEILYDWIREEPRYGLGHPGPGTRPWAWWEFDAPELRKRTDSPIHPFDNPGRKALIEEHSKKYPDYKKSAYKTNFGALGSLIWPDDFQATFESEATYLIRLGLLLPGEREMIEQQQ